MNHTPECDRCESQVSVGDYTLVFGGEPEEFMLCPDCFSYYREQEVEQAWQEHIREREDDEYEQLEEDIYEVEDPISLVIKDAEADGSGDPE